jgi:hypothetical protein
MWIVAVAWIYVVALMAATETSVVAGVMTFVGYCLIPLSILFYLTGGKRRRARREAAAANASDGGGGATASRHDKDGDNSTDSGDSGSDGGSGGGSD